VFDYGVNSGIGRAARVLQRLLGLPDDGIVGPRTLAAAACADALRLIDAICDERLAFLQGLRTWPVFGNGWGRRVREVRAAARAIAARNKAAGAAPERASDGGKPKAAAVPAPPAPSASQGHRELAPPASPSLVAHLASAVRRLFHKPN
jgi:lysozyme family protein